MGVRWLAADGLIDLGHDTLAPVLEALIGEPGSSWIRDGVHHVLSALRAGPLRPIVAPVIRSLEGDEPALEAPIAAAVALEALRDVQGEE